MSATPWMSDPFLSNNIDGVSNPLYNHNNNINPAAIPFGGDGDSNNNNNNNSSSLSSSTNFHHHSQSLGNHPVDLQTLISGTITTPATSAASPSALSSTSSSSFKVQPVIPLKRSHPREDIISNQQRLGTPPGLVNSQTLLLGVNNGTISPSMQNFGNIHNTQPPPKRVATQSPTHFPSSTQAQGPFPTPQNPNMMQNFVGQTRSFSPPNRTSSSSPMSAGLPPQNIPSNASHNQVLYNQIQRQNQQRMFQQPGGEPQQNRINQGGPAMSSAISASPNPNARMTARAQPNPDQFIKSLQDFMIKRGTPLTSLTFTIGDHRISLVFLYASVMKLGGSRAVISGNLWTSVATMLNISLDAFPNAPDLLMRTYMNNLAPYEEAWQSRAQNERKLLALKQQQQQQQQQHQLQQQHQHQHQHQHQQQQQQQHQHQQQQQQQQQQLQQQQQQQSQQPQQQHQHQQQIQQQQIQQQHQQQPQIKKSGTLQEQGGTKAQQLAQQGRAINGGQTKQTSLQQPKPPSSINEQASKANSGSAIVQPQAQSNVTDKISNHFHPRERKLDTHGGFDLGVMSTLGNELAHFRPTVPTYGELGSVDIHALIMSLKSGMQAEVRVALDTLATVSVESQWSSLSLKSCDGLVEALVEVVESDVSFLNKHGKRLKGPPALLSYEEVLRQCRLEATTVTALHDGVGVDHDLDRAADRVIGVTTILRNLSFFESNHSSLAENFVIKFAATVVHILANTELLLRNYANTLDFMKDMIIFLSNLAQQIILPDEESARSLLFLILSFAPQPQHEEQWEHELQDQSIKRGGPLFFTYHPSIHRYLPPAVDSLAKLLARDEPNRGYFRTVIGVDLGLAAANELLTSTFGLAISPIPLHNNLQSFLPQVVETRKPYLEQGLLAAEILVDFIPDSDSRLASDWLTSEDSFASNLQKFICLLSPHQTITGRGTQPKLYAGPEDSHPFARIVHRGLSILERLLQKAGFMDDSMVDEDSVIEKPVEGFPFGIVPRKEVLIGTVLSNRIDANIVSALVNFASMTDEI